MLKIITMNNFLKFMITLFIIAVFLFTAISYAGCEKPVTYLQEGTVTQCDGYLFTRDKEAENYKLLEQGKLYKELSVLQSQENEILNKRLENMKQEYDSLYKQSKMTDLEKGLYFFGGATITYLLFNIVKHNQ